MMYPIYHRAELPPTKGDPAGKKILNALPEKQRRLKGLVAKWNSLAPMLVSEALSGSASDPLQSITQSIGTSGKVDEDTCKVISGQAFTPQHLADICGEANAPLEDSEMVSAIRVVGGPFASPVARSVHRSQTYDVTRPGAAAPAACLSAPSTPSGK